MNLTEELHATIVSAGKLRIIVDGIECVLVRFIWLDFQVAGCDNFFDAPESNCGASLNP